MFLKHRLIDVVFIIVLKKAKVGNLQGTRLGILLPEGTQALIYRNNPRDCKTSRGKST